MEKIHEEIVKYLGEYAENNGWTIPEKCLNVSGEFEQCLHLNIPKKEIVNTIEYCTKKYPDQLEFISLLIQAANNE